MYAIVLHLIYWKYCSTLNPPFNGFLAELFIIVTVMAEQSLLDPLQLPLLTTCSPN